jgi:hypothetical protein
MPQQTSACREPGVFARDRRIAARSALLTAHDPSSRLRIPAPAGLKGKLLTEAGLHRDALAALGPPARDHRLAAFGFHTSTKAVRLRAMTPVRLECALGHETSLLLIEPVALGQEKSINDTARTGKRTAASGTIREKRFSGHASEMLAPCGFCPCTSCAAVIISTLDRISFRVLNQRAEEKFLVEHFHATDFFCASMPIWPGLLIFAATGTAHDRKAAPLEMNILSFPMV